MFLFLSLFLLLLLTLREGDGPSCDRKLSAVGENAGGVLPEVLQ